MFHTLDIRDSTVKHYLGSVFGADLGGHGKIRILVVGRYNVGGIAGGMLNVTNYCEQLYKKFKENSEMFRGKHTSVHSRKASVSSLYHEDSFHTF